MDYDSTGASRPVWSVTAGVPAFPLPAAAGQPAFQAVGVGIVASAAASTTAWSEDLQSIRLATDKLATLQTRTNQELRCIEKPVYFIEQRSTC